MLSDNDAFFAISYLEKSLQSNCAYSNIVLAKNEVVLHIAELSIALKDTTNINCEIGSIFLKALL